MHEKVRLLGSILKALFCVLLLSAATYAWLSANRDADTGSMQVQLDGESMSITEYDVLRFNPETLEFENVSNTYEVFHLIPYDSIFTERNVDTPVLLRVLLEGVPGNELYFTIECDPAHDTPKTLANGNQRWTSDIVYINYITESALNAALGTAVNDSMLYSPAGRETMYRTAVDYLLNDQTNRVQFATAVQNGSTYAYNSSKNVELDCTVPLTAEDQATQSTVVYLIIDYDPALIEAQNMAELRDFDIRLGLPVEFTSDIARIAFTGLHSGE